MYREGGGLLLSLGQFVFDLLTVKCNDEDPKTPKFSLKSFFLPTFGSNKQKFWLFFTLKLENFDQNTKLWTNFNPEKSKFWPRTKILTQKSKIWTIFYPKIWKCWPKYQNFDKNLTLFIQKKP